MDPLPDVDHERVKIEPEHGLGGLTDPFGLSLGRVDTETPLFDLRLPERLDQPRLRPQPPDLPVHDDPRG